VPQTSIFASFVPGGLPDLHGDRPAVMALQITVGSIQITHPGTDPVADYGPAKIDQSMEIRPGRSPAEGLRDPGVSKEPGTMPFGSGNEKIPTVRVAESHPIVAV